MMTCAEARDLLLEADLAERRGAAPGPLDEHLAACADCRRVAERILATTDALRRERTHGPRRAADQAAAAAAMEAVRIRRTRRRWLVAVPTLAAAGIAAAILARGTPGLTSAPAVASAASAAAASADLPLVVGAAQDVAVFTTANPDIVVVWQF